MPSRAADAAWPRPYRRKRLPDGRDELDKGDKQPSGQAGGRDLIQKKCDFFGFDSKILLI